MSLAKFLSDLHETGHVEVALVSPDDALVDQDAAMEWLRERDRATRLEWPGNAPDFVPEAALWGAQALYWGCWCFLDRNQSVEPLEQRWFNPAAPDPRDPARVYSVDLTLSYLPDFWRHVVHFASADPLATATLRLGKRWPLSSVGIPQVTPSLDDLEPWIRLPALRQAYIDRVLETDDASRLDHPLVLETALASLGLHGEILAGREVQARLESLAAPIKGS